MNHYLFLNYTVYSRRYIRRIMLLIHAEVLDLSYCSPNFVWMPLIYKEQSWCNLASAMILFSNIWCNGWLTYVLCTGITYVLFINRKVKLVGPFLRISLIKPARMLFDTTLYTIFNKLMCGGQCTSKNWSFNLQVNVFKFHYRITYLLPITILRDSGLKIWRICEILTI